MTAENHTVDILSVRVPNHHSGPQEGYDWLPLFDTLPNPLRRNAELVGGYSGHGIVWETVPHMWHCLAFALLWTTARYLSKRVLFPPVARALGIPARKKGKIAKFSYNMWLALFYLTSALFGYFYVLPGEKFFEFPITLEGAHHLWSYHPFPINDVIHWYYMYQLGFYFAELYAIFREPRRSDFMEYVIHHVVTIYLVGVSYAAHEHRVGALIILIHDIPDIFLCVSKLLHYSGFEGASTGTFAVFVGSFAYMRLYCFPLLSRTAVCLAPQYHPATLAFWSLTFLYTVVLQGLQVFWFIMIIRLVVVIIAKNGKNEGDPRSDSEDESGVASGERLQQKSRGRGKRE